MPLSRAKATRLRDTIAGMNETQLWEIFRIIKAHDVTFTAKADGVFFEDRALNDAAVADIEAYIKFCNDVKTELGRA